MSDYEFDVFLSYSRKGGSPGWVHNHFLPKLRDCLIDQVGYEPKVFVDQEMEPGTVWPHRLENVLNRSKILVSIYSPQYFRSPWCLAEWHTMAERERILGLASLERPQGLIFPILYTDSDNFPTYAKDRSWHNLKGLSTPDLVLQQSLDWIEFHKRMEKIATDLARLLPQVPPWQPGWPAQRPDPPEPPTTRFPEF